MSTQAISVSDSLKAEIPKLNGKEKFLAIIRLSDSYTNNENKLALEAAENALEHAKSFNYIQGEIWALSYIGELTSSFQENAKALDILQNALSMAISIEDTLHIANCYSSLGFVYSGIYDHESALSNYRLGLKYAKVVNRTNLITKIMNNMATLFSQEKEYQLAIETYTECLQILEENNIYNTRAYSIMTMNSGFVYSQLDESEKAIVCFKKAIKGFNKNGGISLIPNTYVGLVREFTNQNHLDSATFYYKKAVESVTQDEQLSAKLYRLLAHANIQFARADFKRAAKNGKYIFNLGKKDSTNSLYVYQAAKLVYESYQKLDTYDSAYHYMVIYKNWENLSLSNHQKEQVQAMRTQFEAELGFQKKKREIESLQLKEKIQKEEIELQKNWRYFLILISLLGATLTFLVINRFKLKAKTAKAKKNQLELEKQNLSLQIEHKNRELTSTSMFVAQKNQLLMNLQEHLGNLKNVNDDEVKKEIRNLKYEIKSNIHLEEDWENIKLHFDEVYPSFFQNLTKRFPDLTNLELKHCAYLKMSLSVKEVARMLSVAPKSVQMSHYRLKKKMALDTNTSLSQFIDSI